MTLKNKQFYFLSLAALAVLSAYPLINGARMAYFHLTSGALEPEQYVKYVVPYAAICVSVLFFAALQPLLSKLKRLAITAGTGIAYGVFFTAERFFETMRIRTVGMTLIDAASLVPDDAVAKAATADIWQAALCIVSPVMREQSLTYASKDHFFYVAGNTAYKIHYYLISLILITMVCGLIFGIAEMIRSGDISQKKPLFLRGVSAAALVALCVFANTTAFFRRAAPIQTPLASALTALFFVALGAAAGIYAGSFLLRKGRFLGMGLPVSLSLGASVLMYVGEAAMMGGNLYRFGTGPFFREIPGIVAAPADILVILLSGGLTLLLLSAARSRKRLPDKRAEVVAFALCAAVASIGPVIAATAPQSQDEDIIGCYVFDKNIYTNPLSSFMAAGGLPYVYGFGEDFFIIANTSGGEPHCYSAEYCKTPVGADEFRSKMTSLPGSLFSPHDLSGFKERYLTAVMSDAGDPKYGLYRMDGEIWLVELWASGIRSIYRLVKTDTTALSDINRVIEYYAAAPPVESPSGIYENPPRFYENQMTAADVYALARKGESLELIDFEPFFYWLAGSDFTERRFDVVGADTVFVTVEDNSLKSAVLMSRKTLDPSQVIDLREGFEAVFAYMHQNDFSRK
ncbi:MAG: hypothetical protein FWG32_04850 [Oscillospiraceae bacterium]|nr:hypothetical protein [Oscillospiraceae bacterium]